MLFDKNEFLDLLPQKTWRQRLSESWKFRLAGELLLVAGMGWLLWFSLVRVHLPGEIAAAYQNLDQAVSERDPLKVMALFPSDVSILVDGLPVSLGNFSDVTTAFLQSREIRSVKQSTQLVWARHPSDDSLEVRAVQLQTIERPDRPTQQRRLGLTMMWTLTSAGWRLKSYSSKSLRPR